MEKAWEPSIGEKFFLDNFREPPPGLRHVTCYPGRKSCLVHKDTYNPHASLGDALNHFLEWEWSPYVIAGIFATPFLLYAIKTIIESQRSPV